MDRCKNIISRVLFYLVLLLIVAATFFFLLQKRSGRPMLVLDRCILWVQTGSMQPTIPEKSYILVKSTGDAEPQVGDVIVFLCRDSTSPVYGSYVTHRVVEQTPQGYKTRGDSPLSYEDPWTVSAEDILGIYQRNLPVMTVMGRIFSTPMGMVIVFALFFAVCGFVCIPTFVKTLQKEPELTAQEFDDLVQQELRRLEEEGLSPHDDLGSDT